MKSPLTFIGSSSTHAVASRVMERCDLLARHSEDATCLTRTFCSPAMRDAQSAVAEWMQAAGMRCHTDAIGNLIGRRAGGSGSGKALLMGSHIDSVPNAGHFDGVLGVLLAIAVVEILNEQRIDLPFNLDVISFSEEEGIRYQTPFLGSRAIAGCFDNELLTKTDAKGVTMTDAIRAIGQDPLAIAAAAHLPEQVLCFVEAHIEQGPVLEQEHLPLGVVEAIAGQTRASVRFVGVAGHAGTTPMDRRQDALVAAAELIAEVERVGQGMPDLVATVGHLSVWPNAPNVIPDRVELTLDVRHSDDTSRDHAVHELLQFAERSATVRHVQFEILRIESHPAVQSDRALTAVMEECLRACGISSRRMISGAGHDAQIMAKIAPMTLLFVRCAGGISHHPDESVLLEDAEAALQVLVQFVMRLVARGAHGEPE